MDLFGGCVDLAGGVGQCFPPVLSERQSLRSSSSSESEYNTSEVRKEKKKPAGSWSPLARRSSYFTGTASHPAKEEARVPVIPIIPILPEENFGTSPKKTDIIQYKYTPERPPLSPVERSMYSLAAEQEFHEKWNRPVVW
ncbi:uncharacterized protein LOC129596866 [Paramacrobiotus metropolitanus]|uniref:uncharacterized protein LOC129596866 n=1 Tax=Paramacrobiotus metropolitanus TaxID=2943436 RepID=UPI00244575FE|nr:uncharacterized protein LOC129596866 [Paramacrobiotus metropolitanus]